MAYRSKRRTTTRKRSRRTSAPRRRRRMGAAPGSRKDRITRTLLTIAGAAGASFAQKQFGGDGPGKLDPKIIAGITLAAGFFLPQFIKHPMVAGVADGLMVGGGISLLNEFGVLSGIPIVAGWKELSTVNGTGTAPAARKVNEAVSSDTFKPTTSQLMNNYYRRAYDGR